MSELATLLTKIYGEGGGLQVARYREAIDAFTAVYGPGEIWLFRAPGRVNLIGGHTDYNHGYVMPVALDKDVLLLARPRADTLVRLRNVEPAFVPISFTLSYEIPTAEAGDWGNYARGAAQAVANGLKKRATGFDALVSAEPPFGVPRGAGLSSSSALTVVTAVTTATLNQWQPDSGTLGQLCAEAEWYVGTRGGIMDQFISVMGQRDHALFLDCRPEADGTYRTAQVPLPADYSLLVINSGVKHSNVRGSYNHRVAACRAGVGLLQVHYPDITHLRDVEAVPWEQLEPHLPERVTVGELNAQGIDLTDIPGITAETTLHVRARCRHVWSENQRVHAAVAALHEQDMVEFGRLLAAAHASARDDYDISCLEIELIVTLLGDLPSVLGARLSGAGWGGCVVAMVEKTAVSTLTTHLQTHYTTPVGTPPDIFACTSTDGAGFIGKMNS